MLTLNYPENVVEVLGEYGRGKALLNLVVPLNCFLKRLAFQNIDNWGKCFTMDNWRIVSQTSDNCWLDKIPITINLLKKVYITS